jgi:adenine-specific DNA methylase
MAPICRLSYGDRRYLKVADIFMGGGTTLVEGSRLGMQMYGTDLNPVAWFSSQVYRS